MKRTDSKRVDSKRVPEALPSFLDGANENPPAAADAAVGAQNDDGTVATADDAVPAADETSPESESVEAAAEATDATEPLPADEGVDANADLNTDEVPAADEQAPAPQPRPARGPRTGGTFAMALGGLVLLLALATSLVPSLVKVSADLGVPANVAFVLGMLLFAAGVIQRHIGGLQQRLDEAESRRQRDADAVNQNLQQLVADKSQRPVSGNEEIQHLQLAMQRQDEKINNLTKAIKMYGKPLMEITGQGTDIAGNLANVKTLVEGNHEALRQGMQRMEAQLRAPTQNKDLNDIQGTLSKLAARVDTLSKDKELAEIQAALIKIAARCETMAKDKGGHVQVDLAPLQQQLGRVEVNLAAVAQRLDDKDVHKSLLRLEEANTKSRDAMQELLRGETVQKAATMLQERLDQGTKRLADGITQMRDGNLGGLESGLRDLQREMASVATTVAQINAAVKNGARAAAAAAAQPAPAPAAAPAPAPAAAPAAAKGTAPTAAPAAGEPASGYQTGTRTSGGKNVLGAIAKLKQMKG